MKIPSILHPVAMLLAFFLTAQSLNAQPAIDLHQIAGGGGTSAKAPFSVTGTIGQFDASMSLTGGSYSLSGGLWGSIVVMGNTNIPVLFIDAAGGSLTVHWQTQTGWSLQENRDLSNPAGWMNSSATVTVSGVTYHSVTNPSSPLFFRLKRS